LSNLRITQWLGEISYPLYLWHWPLLVIPMVYFGRGLSILERAIAILATLLLALPSRYMASRQKPKVQPQKQLEDI
jgi:peptidoglycan/LPS O-acetylase OafA/YrhL